MEENLVKISEINDFIFCPVSIYFHALHGNIDTIYYHTEKQVDGKYAHDTIDHGRYSTSSKITTGMDVCSDTYGVVGKIDVYDEAAKTLTERKKKIIKIYDGYIFQLYGQYFALKDMGISVEKMQLCSYDDNKAYSVKLPEEDAPMAKKFEDTIKAMRSFKMENFKQTNIEKCKNCIYESVCDRSLL